MLKTHLLKATGLLTIGKYLVLLILPLTILYANGRVQAVERMKAEQRVLQLTNDLRIMSKSLAIAEDYVTRTKIIRAEHAKRLEVLNDENSDVLDMPAPATVVDILRSQGAEPRP